MADTVVQRGLSDIVEHAVRELVSVAMVQGRALVRMPMTLPSGTAILVAVEERGGGRFKLTELGEGLEEAELAGREEAYRAVLTGLARNAGMQASQGLLVLDGLTEGQIAGGLMAVAQTLLRAAEDSLARVRSATIPPPPA